MIILNQPVKVAKGIMGTDWMLYSLTVTESFGLVRKGNLTLLKTQGGGRETYTWEAKYSITQKWDITGPGAKMRSGERVPAKDSFPFSLDPLTNEGIKKILSDWLDANARNNTCLGIPPPGQSKPSENVQPQQVSKPVAPVTNSTAVAMVSQKPVESPVALRPIAPVVPPAPITPVVMSSAIKKTEIPDYLSGEYRPPAKPKVETKPVAEIKPKTEIEPKEKEISMKQKKPANQALIDFVVSAVLKMRGKTKDEMEDSHNRECVLERAIVSYILKQCGEPEKNIQETINAKSPASPWLNVSKAKELFASDPSLKASAENIIKQSQKFITEAPEVVVPGKGPEKTAEPKVKKAKGAKRDPKGPHAKKPGPELASPAPTPNGNGHTSKAELTDILVYLLSEGAMMGAEKLAPIFKMEVNGIYMSVGKVQTRFHGDKQIAGVVEELRKLDLSGTIAKLT